MDISYFGHSCFKIKGAEGTVVIDPYTEMVGFSMPTVSADMVIVSHDHADHNNIAAVGGTARRAKPFTITEPGEYEVGGISVFGVSAFHDANQGAERGKITMYSILMDGIKVCHLGDLGHELTPEQLEDLGEVDVLLCPVGGNFTIDPEMAVKVIQSLEPRLVIPMHYRTELHSREVFGDVKPLADFLNEYGSNPAPIEKLSIDRSKLPEETELVVLQPQMK